VGPYAIGWLKDLTGTIEPGVLVIALFQGLGAAGVIALTKKS
jgi:hypothetical protein